MGRCGIPTVTCVLLLLFMAALYASADNNQFVFEENAQSGLEWPQVRQERSAQIQENMNARGRQGRIADGTEANGDMGRRRSGGRRGNGSRRRGRPDGGRGGRGGRGRNRGRGSSRNQVEGVTRRDLSLATKLHNASSVFGSRLLTNVFGPQVRYNTVISPYSIHTALAMTSLGARRGTQREILASLGLPQTGLRRRMVHRAYRALIRMLGQDTTGAVLESANAVFVKPNIPLEENFRRGLSENYNATFDTFNFGAPGGAEAPINQWVSDATRGHIQDLLAPGTLTPLTGMILLNAVYFNATFKTAFDTRLTKLEDFTTLSLGVQQIPTMSVTGTFMFASHFETQVVELPYTGEKHALYILIPSASSSVEQLLEDLEDTERFGINPVDRFLSGLQPMSMKFMMPKFRIEADSISLKAPLQQLGIRKAFDQRADFSGISMTHLEIADVVHKAFIDIKEEGTEAAAATAVIFEIRSGFSTTRIAADRPFVYMVRDMRLKTILFMGTFMGQTKSQVEM